ncbi:zinc finger protein 271 isoform X3 [Malaya genurostris]|uniref:zinc finger protein 271 isoform X3 n=1 Tax=Malaya genurostris TaxID=325434 RepID=UPI0026F3E030|nr:zinc finger protein 271 isoform X3 [Malaya genurostris]
MNRPSLDQFDQVCRLCLNLVDLVYIFERNTKTQKESLGLLMRETVEMLGLSIEPDDGLPKKICINCKNFLRQLYKFRNQCQEANDLLVEAFSCSPSDKQPTSREPPLQSNIQSQLKIESFEQVIVESENISQNIVIHAEAEEATAEASNRTLLSNQVSVKKESPHVQKSVLFEENVEQYEFLEADQDEDEEEEVLEKIVYNKTAQSEAGSEPDYVIETFDILSEEQNPEFGADNEERNEYESTQNEENQNEKESRTVNTLKTESNKGQLCKICGKHSTCLKYHMMCHTGERPFPCNQCEKSFRTATKLRIHVNGVHLKIRKYTCNICNKKFLDSGNLRNHKVIHSGERKHVCDYEGCGKTFALQGTLAVHKKSHTQDKQFACDYCSKQFLYKWLLVKHLRIHTGEKPYQCDVCYKSFTTITHMHTHKKSHDPSREKPTKIRKATIDRKNLNQSKQLGAEN